MVNDSRPFLVSSAAKMSFSWLTIAQPFGFDEANPGRMSVNRRVLPAVAAKYAAPPGSAVDSRMLPWCGEGASGEPGFDPGAEEVRGQTRRLVPATLRRDLSS